MATAISRRGVLTGLAGALAFRAGDAATLPRPGCQANGWDLDPNRFELLLTAVKEMQELGFQGFETNIRFVQPQLAKVAEARGALDAIGLEVIGAHTNLGNYETQGIEKTAADIAKLAAQAKQFGAKALVLSNKGLSQDGEFPAEALKQKARVSATRGWPIPMRCLSLPRTTRASWDCTYAIFTTARRCRWGRENSRCVRWRTRYARPAGMAG